MEHSNTLTCIFYTTHTSGTNKFVCKAILKRCNNHTQPRVDCTQATPVECVCAYNCEGIIVVVC